MVEALRAVLPEWHRAVTGSGLRQGEVFGPVFDGLDFLRTRTVDVHQQLVCLSPEPPYLGPPKTAESVRAVPLAQRTLDALAAHLAAFPAAGVETEDRTDPRNPVTRSARLVFITSTGSPMTRSQWSQIWRPAARTARVPEGVGLHSLRLGHSSAAVTLDTYTHLWPDSDDRTWEAVERALSAPADTVRTEGRSS